MPKANHFLAVCVLGPARSGLLQRLVRTILDRGGEIAECRMAPLGNFQSVNCLVAGDWSALGRLEAALPGLAQQMEGEALLARVEQRPTAPEYRPYSVDIVAPDSNDLMAQLLHFFSQQGVVVTDLGAQRYESAYTGAYMANLQLSVNVPVSHHPPALREAFMDLCDELHADGIMDPIKN